MTAIPHPLAGVHGHDDAHAHAHEELGFIKKYLFSCDHKIIGIQFLFMGLFFMVVGGLLAMLIRWQLAWPFDANHPVPILGKLMGWTGGIMPSEFYTMAFSMHASIMIFFVIIPLLVGTFGNYLIPLKIGAPDMAFPFLNGFAFWSAIPAGAIMLASFFLQGGASAAGWTVYPPLSALQQNKEGHVSYEKPTGAFGSFIQFLRVHDLGGALAGNAKTDKGVLTQEYTGSADRILHNVKAAAASLNWPVVSSSGDTISLKPDKGQQLNLTLAQK